MPPLAEIDLVLRGMTLGLLLLVALQMLLRRPLTRIALAFTALAVALAGYVMVSASGELPAGTAPGALRGMGILLAMLVPALLWWAGLELFELAEPVLKLLPAVVLAVLGLAVLADRWPVLGLARGLLIAALYAHLLFVAWRADRDDLVEARRAFRRWLTVAVAVLGLVITAVELSIPDDRIGPAVRALQAAALAALTLTFALWLQRVQGAFWPAPPAAARPGDARAPALPPADRVLADRLEAAMVSGIWRCEGLTIGALASELGVPEHRLRQVINRGLGHRNFSRFINERRIAAARAMLADPAQAGTPILTIAYDCGFASLGPFNRAFRDLTGQSPSAFRAESLEKPAED